MEDFVLDRDIRFVKGVGPRKSRLFENLGIFTVSDILQHFPVRYQDRSQCITVREAFSSLGEHVLLRCKLLSVRKKYTRSRVSIYEALIQDETSAMVAVWFGKKFIDRFLIPGKTYFFYGRVERFAGRIQINNPEFEEEESQGKEGPVNKIVPVYRVTTGISQRYMRKIILEILSHTTKELKEFIPFTVRDKADVPNRIFSYKNVHFPQDWQSLDKAKMRFIFEELFLMQVLVFMRKAQRRRIKGPEFIGNDDVGSSIEDYFKFTFTPDQKTTSNAIINDLCSGYVMHRLLQGDVGSGKTAVAVCASLLCCMNKWQVAFMVPTEILAMQHFQRLKPFFASKGFKTDCITASSTKSKKESIYRKLKEGSIDVVLGTHSLLDEKIEFKKLGLVIIDEQHRFGVAQRAYLLEKGRSPHLLVMTATPIPRTLSLTIYGDLDISYIKTLPPGRTRPRMSVYEDVDKNEYFPLVREQLNQGRQAYFVYPLIENYLEQDLEGARQGYLEVKEYFKDYNVQLLHGRLPQKEQKKIMEDFQQGAINILVCTQVIEVGIDVPNANCLVINHPQRFGLSQLHQLRGRIMRSSGEAYCLVIAPSNLSPRASQRIDVFVNTWDGFELSEEDLLLRGPGDFLGLRQHGLPGFKMADPVKNFDVLKNARFWAYNVVKSDPELVTPPNEKLREALDWYYKKCTWFQAD